MSQLKDKYQFILAFAALYISLSAFKNELALYEIEIGYTQISLDYYFLATIIGFLICLYLYSIYFIGSTFYLEHWLIFKYLLNLSYILFILIILSPIILSIVYCFYLVISLFQALGDTTKNILSVIVSFSFGVVASLVAVKLSKKYIKEKESKKFEDLENEEIEKIDTAMKLYKDRYFSHAILETFKILELHLYKLLSGRNIATNRGKFQDLLTNALENEILNKEDLSIISEIREMRNSVAHLDVDFNEVQAKKALDFVKGLIKRTSGQDHDKVGTIAV